MSTGLEALQAELDAVESSDATDAPAAEETVTEEETVTTPEEEGDPPDSEEDPPPDSEAEDEPPDAEPEAELDPQWLLKWADSQPDGGSFAQKYQNDAELLRGLMEAHRLVGKRDEDAQTLKQLRDRIGEDRLKTLLAEEAATKSKPARDDRLPRSVDEYLLLEDAATRPDATPATREKFAVAQKAMLERFLAPSASQQDPESIKAEIAKTVAEEMKQYTQTEEQKRVSEQTQAAEVAWVKQNSAKIYVDGSRERGFSPLGKRVAAILDTDQDVKECRTQVGQWRMALKLAESEQPTPKQPRKPSQQAQRRAPVKTGTPKQMTVAEMFDKGKGLAEVAQLEMEQDKAAEP